MSIRWAAQELAARMGKEVTFTGTESETALLNNREIPPAVRLSEGDSAQMLDWTAHGCNRAARAGISRLTSKREREILMSGQVPATQRLAPRSLKLCMKGLSYRLTRLLWMRTESWTNDASGH